MSFIDTYMKNRVDLTDSTRSGLEDIERRLNQTTSNSKNKISFLDAIKDHGEHIANLIERVRQYFTGFKLTWSNAFETFQFVYSIALEVYQIIKAIQDSIVPLGASPEETWSTKRQFGQDLTYFIWKSVGPLDSKFNWIPFKKTIEKRIVLWLAKLGLEAAKKLFDRDTKIESLSVSKIPGFIRAL